jgi:hypothetical protein
MSDPRIPKSLLPPRGLSANDAARYIGISRNTFLKLVRFGFAPPALDIPETNRKIYDRHAIDQAMSSLAVAVTS